MKDPPNLIRKSVFSEFVRRIYEQRHTDRSSNRNGKLVVDTDALSIPLPSLACEQHAGPRFIHGTNAVVDPIRLQGHSAH